jgi:hypothetical protein
MWKFFSRKKAKVAEPSAEYVPGTQLSYDPTLITKLTADHRELIDLYKGCAAAYGKSDKKLAKELAQFKRKLTSHLLVENLRFYTYMKYLLKSDSDNTVLMRHFQTEMGEIGKVVFAFLDRYTQPGAVYDIEFKAEFDQIGAALVARIEAEENDLYTLYCSPSSI